MFAMDTEQKAGNAISLAHQRRLKPVGEIDDYGFLLINMCNVTRTYGLQALHKYLNRIICMHFPV